MSRNDAPDGAAVAALGSEVWLEHSELDRNCGSERSGAAVWSRDAFLNIYQSKVTKSSGGGDGGAIHIEERSYLDLAYVTLAENRCLGRGGGLFAMTTSTVLARAVIFALNCAYEGEDLYLDDEALLYEECSLLDSTKVAGPGACITYQTALQGDPGFVQSSGCGPDGESDYHLRIDSQCRNAQGCGAIGYAGLPKDGAEYAAPASR
ncbi:MAG: hypothetical protein QUU85_03690 [Candidatus Eisenbacteria bacterium]|nr:hypothetical protein [Candidatus Eisenbacteria bacterium]